MNKSFSLCLLLLCLFYSMAQASLPSQNDFDFLEPFNDSALVANGLELTKSIAGVSLSALLNLGIWWGVCKTAGIVSGLSSTSDLAESDTKELEHMKTDFCLQLAPVITTAEVALAGHVSPWPLEQRWWKPLYFAGAGMAAYAASMKTREHIPVAVLIYLAGEALSRTAASASSVLILRNMRTREIAPEWYAAGEYAVLSIMNGVVAGAVVYEVMIHKGIRPAQATTVSVVSAAIAGTLSRIISVLTIVVDGQLEAGVSAAARVVASVLPGAGAVVIGAGVAALAGLGAKDVAVASVGAGALVAVTAVVEDAALVGAGAGALARLGARAETLAVASVGVIVTAGAGAGVAASAGASAFNGVSLLLMLGSSKITSNNPFIKAGFTLVPALSFAFFNSLSNYAVYGHPLEQSFSETGWTQWKKFYAPLDYLSTLFN
ncbi:hypothetical protein [Endozoicomonas sp. ISHI1]|uniref:hypothetical protein n=1 Tax=Endozoicomonas sp. ISHI1 TaxID=2825882 RepID=UPI002148EFCA|nr:hypothetical protein [Endozoicomonas sp. ISHI1]